MSTAISLPIGFDFRRLDAASFAELERQWARECANVGDEYSEFATSYIDHARCICGEPGEDERYGIFALEVDGSFEAILHLNRAQLPGTKGYTLRVLWFLGSPRYDLISDDPAELGDIIGGLLTKILSIAHSVMRSSYIKIHVGSMPDRAILSGMAQDLHRAGKVTEVAARGNWLHIAVA